MKKNDLFAPQSYINASPEVLKAVLNGCGTAGWKGWIVPDTLYFLSITPACNIHDWMYTAGSTKEDKEEADRVFLNNMIRLIEEAGGPWLLKKLRRNRAYVYYESVSHFGGPAFWDGKNSNKNLMPQPV